MLCGKFCFPYIDSTSQPEHDTEDDGPATGGDDGPATGGDDFSGCPSDCESDTAEKTAPGRWQGNSHWDWEYASGRWQYKAEYATGRWRGRPGLWQDRADWDSWGWNTPGLWQGRPGCRQDRSDWDSW